MKKMFLAALTVLSLSAAVVPLANAQSYAHSGPYDNTANSLNRTVVGGQ
jgi:hypothetical protein